MCYYQAPTSTRGYSTTRFQITARTLLGKFTTRPSRTEEATELVSI